MERRELIALAGALLVDGCVRRVPAPDDPSAVKRSVADFYAAYSGFDKEKYRALLTEDYLLLEDGELLDIDGDIAGMPSPETHPRRKDVFDFRSVKIQGDFAYAAYFLSSDISDDKGTRTRQWLESAILRRSGRGWRMALLHSTKVSKPAGPGG